ncbi:MAG: signal peptide peptidase SppA [candidate division WOR-3 bacterium]
MMGIGLMVLAVIGVTPQMPLSIAGSDGGLAIFANPAGLGRGKGLECYYIYNFQPKPVIHNSTLVLGLGSLAGYWEPGSGRYGVGLGMEQDELLVGARMGFDSVARWDLGAMWRPRSWVSIGGLWQDLNHGWGAVSVGGAFRPFGPRLTLFGEGFVDAAPRPVLGLLAEPVNGLKFGLRAKVPLAGEGFGFTAGLNIGLGRVGLGAVRSQAPEENGLCLRVGAAGQRSLIPEKGRVLEIELNCPVLDQRPGFSLSGYGRCRTTWSLLDLLQKATEDKSVRAIFLRLDGFEMSYAQAQELRAALEQFRARGKKVYVWAHNYGMLDYYIASVADRIICHPMSDVVIPGISLQTTFLKGTVEKLGLKFQFQRRGRYKSAVETFTEDSLTPENREQLQALVDAFYEDFIRVVSRGRRMEPARLESLVDRALFPADEAKGEGLVDTLVYDDQLDSLLAAELRGLRRIKERNYRKEGRIDEGWGRLPKIAIITAVGSISLGESHTDFLTGSMTMGANTIVRAIRQAREDKRVKAIVLRIDSPGGDGFASDLIWRELELAKKKKPVVVSMGAVAASGGYYISCPANRVFALPGTVTGSIGVFNTYLVSEGLYNKLGARRQVLKRGEHSDLGRGTRELTPVEDSMLQATVDRFYEQFVRKVAEGRNLTFEHVDSVAQGRVWAGVDARRAGLVDSLGGLLDAVEFAKGLVKVKRCEFDFYPRQRMGIPWNLDRFQEGLFWLRAQ